jgi:hypothetical protein
LSLTIYIKTIRPIADNSCIAMEALAAVGFAANILQFVDSVSHVLKIGNQLRRNGMSDFNSDLERSTVVLQHQVDRIRIQCGTAGCVDEAGLVSSLVRV